jgi:hypothetical protein
LAAAWDGSSLQGGRAHAVVGQLERSRSTCRSVSIHNRMLTKSGGGGAATRATKPPTLAVYAPLHAAQPRPRRRPWLPGCGPLQVIYGPLLDLEVRGVPALQYFGGVVWKS